MKAINFKKTYWHPIFILAVAALFRFLLLSLKPPHSDEGVNGWFADQIDVTGFFNYDPTNYHGPLPIYLIYLFQKVFGHNLWALRGVGSVFGLLTVWLFIKFEKFFDRSVALTAAWFMALSPAMIFFSRGTIQEPVLLFFVVMSVYGFFEKKPWTTVMGFAGMLATKETWTITTLCFGLACLISKKIDYKKIKLKETFHIYLKPALACVGLLIVFYSGFFQNMSGIPAFFKAYLPWLHTAQGNGHEKPFYYWLTLLWRYEAIALLGLIFSVKYISDSNKDKKTLAIFALLQFLFYTAIPYKTPWLMMQIIWPLFFVAGFSFGKKKMDRFILIAFLIISTTQAIHLNFFKFIDESEPYVYVQTFQDFADVTGKIRKAAELNPEIKKFKLFVIMQTSWPLPWVLWDFKNSAYYSSPPPTTAVSEFKGAAVLFFDKNMVAPYDLLLKNDFESQTFKLRPAMGEVVVYFSKKMFHNTSK